MCLFSPEIVQAEAVKGLIVATEFLTLSCPEDVVLRH